MFIIALFMTISFFMLATISVTIVKRLLISREVCEKLYMNILMVFFYFINFICYMYTMSLGFASIGMLENIKKNGDVPLIIIENMQYLLRSINLMSIYLVIGFVFYVATILLIRRMKKEHEEELNKPKELWDWSKINPPN